MRNVDLAKRRVWITGASSGIGRAVALEFGRRGCSLVLSARSREALEKLASELGGVRTCVTPLDVADRTANLAAVDTIRSSLGGLDIAFLNAGTCEYVDVRNFDSDLFERVMRTNFIGMVYGVEAALPLLRESRHPHLVGMSSTLAYGPLPRAEAYGASKAAIRYLLEGLRIERSTYPCRWSVRVSSRPRLPTATTFRCPV